MFIACDYFLYIVYSTRGFLKLTKTEFSAAFAQRALQEKQVKRVVENTCKTIFTKRVNVPAGRGGVIKFYINDKFQVTSIILCAI